MKQLIYAFFLLLSACITGCREQNGVNNDFFVLDVASAIDNRRIFDLGNVSDKIEFIMLDDSSEGSLLGDVYMMEESNSGFYIVDMNNSAVKYFDKTGKFISTKGGIGRGPNEYASISYITVDHENDNVYVASGAGGVLAYDSENYMFARNDSVPGSQISYFNDELVLLKYPSTAPASGNAFSIVNTYSPDLRFQTSIDVPYKGTVSLNVGFQILANNGTSLIVKEELCDTLFCYKDRALEPVGRLDMGKYLFPLEMYDFNMFERWKEFYRAVNMYNGDECIIISLQNGLMGDISHVVFRNNDLSGGFSATGPDGSSGIYLDGIAVTLCCIRDNKLMGMIQTLDLVDNRDVLTRPDLIALAEGLTYDDNPVIVIAELK